MITPIQTINHNPMTDTEITSLAREYAEEATKADASDPNLTDSDINGIRRDVAEYTEEILRFLLRRYELVEKNKLLELYQINRQREWTQQMPTSTAVVLAIESLFPDLGKEVES